MKFARTVIIFAALAMIIDPVLCSGEAAAGSNTGSKPAVRTEQLAVDWNAARKHPRLEMTKLTERQKQAIRRAAVPVLLPDRDGLLGAALITTGPGWSAASMAKGNFSVAVSGNAKVIRIPGAPEPPALSDPALKASGGEGIWEVSFKAFGINYDLSLECFDHSDPRCADDRYVMQLVDSLKLALIDKQ